MLIKFFDRLYEGLPSLALVDATADFHAFRKRLDNLHFLRTRYNKDTIAIRKLARGLSMAERDHAANIEAIRIDCLGLRIYDEIGILLQAKNLTIPSVKTFLKGFCMQLEVSKEKVLQIIS